MVYWTEPRRKMVNVNGIDLIYIDIDIVMLRSLRFRTKQVIKIKVMRAKDKGDKKTDSDKCFYWIR